MQSALEGGSANDFSKAKTTAAEDEFLDSLGDFMSGMKVGYGSSKDKTGQTSNSLCFLSEAASLQF